MVVLTTSGMLPAEEERLPRGCEGCSKGCKTPLSLSLAMPAWGVTVQTFLLQARAHGRL